MKDIRLEIKVRNNLILKRMEEMGIPTVAELCRRAGGVSQEEAGQIVNMRISPFKKYGARNIVLEWRLSVLKIACALETSPEALFSQEILDRRAASYRAVIEASSAEIAKVLHAGAEARALPAADHVADAEFLAAALATLTPKEQTVLRRRYGLDGGGRERLHEIAADFGVTHERIRQIESKALRKLRESKPVAELRRLEREL